MRELSPETQARLNNRFYAQRWIDNGKPLKVHRKIAVVNNFRYNAKYRNLTCFFDTEYLEYDSKTGDEVPRPYDPRKDGILLEKISPIKSKNYLLYKYFQILPKPHKVMVETTLKRPYKLINMYSHVDAEYGQLFGNLSLEDLLEIDKDALL